MEASSFFFSTQSLSDPTRTLTLRSKWVADWGRRVSSIQTVIKKSVVDNDCLGLRSERPSPFTQAELPPATPSKFAYRYSWQKVEEFMKWLDEMESLSLLEIIQRPGTLRPEGEPWSNVYVRSAYQRGLAYAYDNIQKRSAELGRSLGLSETLFPPTFRPTGDPISLLMQQPFHADRLALAYTRVFDELKGVTAAMDQQISRVLTKGIAEGLNPRDIGKLIADRVDKIGLTRGTLIARTEVINIHQQAALNEYYSAEKSTGQVVLVEWKATMDSRTRDTHAERNGRVYTKEEAYSLTGEPNCRCALLPYTPILQGMPNKATAAARSICAKVIEQERRRKLAERSRQAA